MTPPTLVEKVVGRVSLSARDAILEPSFGEGAFLLTLIPKLMTLSPGTVMERYNHVMREQIVGVEMDETLYNVAIGKIEDEWGPLPEGHRLLREDFFVADLNSQQFDLVIGNPPYGGTFNPSIEDDLDKRYGSWRGYKIKKETYSFFIARSMDLLKPDGRLAFVTSDTFLTLKTMEGLRRRLLEQSNVVIQSVDRFSDETEQPTVILLANRTPEPLTASNAPTSDADLTDSLIVNGKGLSLEDVEATGHFSWGINPELAKYFRGKKLADYVVATSGMTIGNNSMFVRQVKHSERRGSHIVEPYRFEYYEDRITLEDERSRARLGKLSAAKEQSIAEQEKRGVSRRNVRAIPLKRPKTVVLPDKSYLPYNKSDSTPLYAPPKWMIYWENDGDAVYTFKKNGNWYLHGVGGKPYFKREGLTWSLVSNRLRMRYLPSGWILDSGSPCCFLKDGVDKSEIWFILGWAQTDLATRILKTAINHTRNIQGKDVEKLPYPWWVTPERKLSAVKIVRELVEDLRKGTSADPSRLQELDRLYGWREPKASGTLTA